MSYLKDMRKVAFPSRDKLFPETREALAHKRIWVLSVGVLAMSILVIRWPSVWEFSLLCCFPVPLFCYGSVRSGVIHRPGMLKIFITLVMVHCVLLAGTLYLWRMSPKSVTGDFGFGFFLIEFAVNALLMHLSRPKSAGKMLD